MISDKRSSVGFRNCTGKRRIKVFALLASLALLFVGNSTFGQFKYNSNALVPFDPAFKMGKLDNGIRYIIRSNPADKGKACFEALFRIGANMEGKDEYGIAHFLEHLYGDYPHYDLTIGKYLESIGLKWGQDISARTSVEKTSYLLSDVPTVKEQVLDSILLILKMFPFHSIPPEIVEKQRKIVLEEWREDSESKIIESTGVFFSHEVTGDSAVINHVTTDRLKQFHDKWYRPDLLTIIAIGDFNAEKMEAKIKQIFSPIPKSEGIFPKIDYSLPANKEPVIKILEDNCKSTNISINYRHEALAYTQKRLRTEIIDKVIRTMFERRMEQYIDKTDRPFNYFATYYAPYPFAYKYDCYEISINSENVNIPDVLNIVLAEKKRIEKYGFKDSELSVVKNEMENIYRKFQFNDIQLPFNEYLTKCYIFLLNGKIFSSASYFNQFAQKIIPTISLKEVDERFKEYTAGIQPTVTISIPNRKNFTHPSCAEIKACLSSENKKLTPLVIPKPITEITDKNIHPGHVVKQTINKDLGTTEWTLSNGMKIVIKQTGFNPNQIVFNGFRKNLSVKLKKEYSYYLFSYGERLYREMGFGNYSNAELAHFIKSKNIVVNKQFAGFSGYTEQSNFKTCLQLIRLKYLQQRWDELKYNDQVKQINIEIKEPEPRTVLWDSINSHFSSCLSCLYTSMKQLKQLHLEIFGKPENFTFIFVGNINFRVAKPLIERYLASINPVSVSENKLPDSLLDKEILHKREAQAQPKAIIHKFRHPSGGAYIGICCGGPVNMDSITVQNPGLLFSDAKYILTRTLLVYYIKNMIREKEHATYSVIGNLYINSSNHALLFGCDFETDPKTAIRINEVAQKTIKQFFNDGLDEKDFEFQKALFIEDRIKEMKSDQWWANQALYDYYHCGINIVTTYLSDIKNITMGNWKRFTHDFYNQGNIIDLLMLPE